MTYPSLRACVAGVAIQKITGLLRHFVPRKDELDRFHAWLVKQIHGRDEFRSARKERC